MTLAISVLPTPASPSRNSGRRRLSARCSAVASDATPDVRLDVLVDSAAEIAESALDRDAVAKESETKAAARREEAWELVARLAEAEAAAEEASSREFEARKTASLAKDELAHIAEFEPVTARSKREEARRLAEQLAYSEAVAEAERLVEEERFRILQMQEAAKQNRAVAVGEARRLVSKQYGVADAKTLNTFANNAVKSRRDSSGDAGVKEASPSWLLWE